LKVLFGIAFLVLGGLGSRAQFSYQWLEVHYDSAWTYKNLQLIPIRFKAGKGIGSSTGYLSLGQAMQQKKVVVKELGGRTGPDKRYLKLVNRSKYTIVAQAGELLKGGKQDRAIAQTTLIAPGRKGEAVDVFCIEKMRWDNKAQPFYHAGSSERHLRRQIDVRRAQPPVWQEIDRQFENRKQTSETWSYLELQHDSTRGNLDYISYFTQKFEQSGGGIAGFVFVSGNEVLSMELFENADLTTTLFRSMLNTYTNSMQPAPDPPVVEVSRLKRFCDDILTTRENQQKLVKTQGNAYRHDGKLIHLIVYGNGY
jgi:hypothetical protein